MAVVGLNWKDISFSWHQFPALSMNFMYIFCWPDFFPFSSLSFFSFNLNPLSFPLPHPFLPLFHAILLLFHFLHHFRLHLLSPLTSLPASVPPPSTLPIFPFIASSFHSTLPSPFHSFIPALASPPPPWTFVLPRSPLLTPLPVPNSFLSVFFFPYKSSNISFQAKFKREEKQHRTLIEKALRKHKIISVFFLVLLYILKKKHSYVEVQLHVKILQLLKVNKPQILLAIQIFYPGNRLMRKDKPISNRCLLEIRQNSPVLFTEKCKIGMEN